MTNSHKTCLLCQSSSLKEQVRYEKDFLVKCQNCGFIFCKNIPTKQELVLHYEGYARNDYLSPITIKRYNEILDGFEKYRKTNKLLDIGSGTGYFIEIAKQRDWNVYGTELTSEAMAICENKGAIMHQGSLSQENYSPEMFDVICSFEVIEHINNPKEDVLIYKNILRNGGVFYFTTPNFNALERYILKEKYSAIQYPEHLSYYTNKTINSLFKESGFLKIKQTSTGFSLSRIRHSLKREDEFKITKNNDDEILRLGIENNILLAYSIRVINYFLNMFNIGNSLKGLYIKKS